MLPNHGRPVATGAYRGVGRQAYGVKRLVTGVTGDRSGGIPVMPDHTPPGRGPLVGAGVALAIAIALPLLVWTYARTGPELWGIPFFFWYQFLLVLVSVVLTSIAYRLVIGHERQRRAAEGHHDGRTS